MTCSSSKSLSQTDPLNNKGSLHQAETHQVVNDQERISLKVVRDLKGIAHERRKTKQRYGNHTIQELDDEIRSSALASQHCKQQWQTLQQLNSKQLLEKIIINQGICSQDNRNKPTPLSHPAVGTTSILQKSNNSMAKRRNRTYTNKMQQNKADCSSRLEQGKLNLHQTQKHRTDCPDFMRCVTSYCFHRTIMPPEIPEKK